MSGLEIRTKIFSPEHEGDKDYCNGKPGSQLAFWIRSKLGERGYKCTDVIQEDYGWGFYISDKNLDIWVNVGLMGDQVDDEPHWGIFTDHDAPFKPLQWLRKREGKATAERILLDIKTDIASEPNFVVVHAD